MNLILPDGREPTMKGMLRRGSSCYSVIVSLVRAQARKLPVLPCNWNYGRTSSQNFILFGRCGACCLQIAEGCTTIAHAVILLLCGNVLIEPCAVVACISEVMKSRYMVSTAKYPISSIPALCLRSSRPLSSIITNDVPRCENREGGREGALRMRCLSSTNPNPVLNAEKQRRAVAHIAAE